MFHIVQLINFMRITSAPLKNTVEAIVMNCLPSCLPISIAKPVRALLCY